MEDQRWARRLLGASVTAGAAVLAYGVRGRSSQMFGRSLYRGPRNVRAVALTFDDGPSESTPDLLETLDGFGVPATFFLCGANVRRLPEVARQTVAAGHEIGNHSDSHPAFYLKSRRFIFEEFFSAQRTLKAITGIEPWLMRPPYGARWFGFAEMQRSLGVVGVMWTVIGKDWTLNAPAVASRVVRATRNGAIICLHDGRQLTPAPDISSTIAAVRFIVPILLDQGYAFRTVSQLFQSPPISTGVSTSTRRWT